MQEFDLLLKLAYGSVWLYVRARVSLFVFMADTVDSVSLIVMAITVVAM